MAPATIIGGRTVAEVLRGGAERHRDRTLLVYEDELGAVSTFTWGELLEAAAGVAWLLAEHGIGRGSRVHLQLPNRPEFLLCWFAAAQLGASIVPTNPLSAGPEIAYAVKHSGAALSVTDRAGAEVVRGGVAGPVLVCEECDLLGRREPARSPAPVTAADELAILYTSGTTSRPKGVRVTHGNYVFAGETFAAAMRLSPVDRLLMTLPLFHANGQYYSTMGALVSGATLIVTHRFAASRWLEQAARHRATVANLFAAPIRMILAQDPPIEPREHALRAVMFAQNLTADEVARWDHLVGAPLIQGYGMTETIGPPLMNSLDGSARPDTVGRPTLPYSCRLVDERGREVSDGEPGELLVGGIAGVSLMSGYLDDADATRQVLHDGWLHTGDVMRVGEDGLYRFVDRRKDMIKRAGENVAASEVEAALLAHPRVRDAAVVGVPDRIRDEEIVAYVVVDAEIDEPALLDFCRSRLARFRVPAAIEIVDELPRTAVGKIQKHVLRSRWLERAATSDEAAVPWSAR